MSTDCREVPTAEECRAAAENITNKCLRECVQMQCSGVKVNCSEYIRKKCEDDSRALGADVGGFVYGGPQTCQQPKKELYWCELPLSRECRAQAMVHELAHTCGWHHKEGQGVPADNGKLLCQ
jgi:hypothetical protein